MSDENENGNVDVAALQAELAAKDEALKEVRQEAASKRVALKAFDGIDVDEYKTLKSQSTQAAQAELETKGKFDEAKAVIVSSYEDKLKVSSDKYASLEGKYKSVVVNDKLIAAAAKQNAFNPSQVAVVLKDNVRLDADGNVEIVSGDGKTLYNEKGDNLSIDDYVVDYLKDNSYMVRGVESGSGSKGGEHKSEESTKLTPQEKIARGFAASKK